jgi:hypothetical protein|tara:strand:+ start:1825 stop:2004 length:180 start_codon:yes stop_codon:yes gene_type:complete
MIIENDLGRIKGIEAKRLQNVRLTYKNAVTDWAKNYWFSVFKKLCVMYGVEKTYMKELH